MLSLVLFAFIIAVSILMNQKFHSINLRQAQDRAKYAAQAGLTRALHSLNTNVYWNAGFPSTPLTGDAELAYQVEIFNNFSGALGDPGVYAPDGQTWVPKGTVWIRSVGKLGNISSGAVGLAGMVGQYRPTFDHAIFGDRQVVVSGTSIIDTIVPGGKADLGSNALSGPAISIAAASVVQGKALCAPTANPSSASVIEVSGGSSVGGREAANETKVVLPFPNRVPPPALFPNTPLSIPASATRNAYNFMPGDYTDVVVDGGDLILSAPAGQQAGRYYINGDLTVTNGGRIMIEHANENFPVILYVRGDATFTGTAGSPVVIGVDSAGNALAPKTLQIYFTEDTAADASTLAMSFTNGNFVSAGDNVAMTITNSDFRGALIGRTVNLSASQLHYDETLRSLPLEGQGKVTLLLQDDVPSSVAQQIAQGAPPAAVPPTQPNPPIPPAIPGPPPPPPTVITGTAAPVVATIAPPAPPAAPAAAVPTAVPATTLAAAPGTTAPAAAPAAPATTAPAAAAPATAPAAAAPAAAPAAVPSSPASAVITTPGTAVPSIVMIPATAISGLPATPTSPGPATIAIPSPLVSGPVGTTLPSGTFVSTPVTPSSGI